MGNKAESRRDGTVFTYPLQPAKDPFFDFFSSLHSRKPALSQMDLGVHTVILPAGHLASLALERFSGVTFAGIWQSD